MIEVKVRTGSGAVDVLDINQLGEVNDTHDLSIMLQEVGQILFTYGEGEVGNEYKVIVTCMYGKANVERVYKKLPKNSDKKYELVANNTIK